MYIKAIPIDISFGNETLTYYVKDNQKKYINIGSIVSIPINHSICSGIVSEIMNNKNSFELEIKSIIEIQCSFPLLSYYQIVLIQNLSSRYFLPIHKVVNFFLPKFILNRLEKNSFQDILELSITNEKNNNRITPIFIHNINYNKFEDIIIQIIGDFNDTVFIFPDDFYIDSFFSKNKQLENNSIIYKNSYTYSKKYKLFLEILSKKKNILFGTRKILQYNLVAYKKLVYIEDSMVKYNYNQFEKYSNFELLKGIINSRQFEVYFISSVPSTEFFYLSKQDKFNYKSI